MKLTKNQLNMIEVSLAGTLRELRKHTDVDTRIENQITFWHIVENLISSLKRGDARFKAQEFTDAIMQYAGIPSYETTTDENMGDLTKIEQLNLNEEHWFTRKMRGEKL